MEFLHPEFLYYMLPALFLLFGLLLTKKESLAHFFSDEVMQKLRVSKGRLSLKARNIIFMLMAILMVVALAGPVLPDGKVEIKAKSADITLALDISDSMLAQDVYPNRLEFAKHKALELLREAPNERMGIMAFAKNSYLVSPLSFDHDAVAFLLKKLSTESITEKGTDFLSLLEVVDKQVKKDSQKYLLILSDGGDKSDFSQEIAFAKEKGISIFILAVGSEKGAPIKLEDGEFIKKNGNILISKRNDAIASLATKTGGVYIQSANAPSDVAAMLQEIEAQSEKKELKSEEIEKFIPLFYFPLGLALLLLLIATSSMSKRERVNLPSAFLLTLVLGFSVDANASLLDFVELKGAKEAYEKGEYAKSSELYERYAKESKKSEAFYNAANGLYKEGKFKEARELYKKAHFDDANKRARNFANLANSYAKEPIQENLQSAIENYESSLKLLEDKQTRENLEMVKKALQKMKEQKQNKENKKQEKKEENQEEKNQGKEKNQENQQDKEQEQKEKESQQKEKDQKEEQQTQESQQEKEEQTKKDKQDKEESQKEKEQEEQEKTESQREERNETKEQLQELSDDTNATQKQEQNSAIKTHQKMSEIEEKKWLNTLNKESGTYLYRLNDEKPKQEMRDEKPW